MKTRMISNIIQHLYKSDDYTYLTDSDYLDIIKRTIELDPSYFLTYIYPKMMSWDYDSFLRMKDQVKSLIEGIST